MYIDDVFFNIFCPLMSESFHNSICSFKDIYHTIRARVDLAYHIIITCTSDLLKNLLISVRF